MRWTRQRRARNVVAGRVSRERSTACRRTAHARTAKSCGSGTRCWCQVGGGFFNPTGFGLAIFVNDGDKTNSRTGKITKYAVKPLRREGRVFRGTCGDYRVLTTLCTRAAGAAGTRLSLRPCFFGQDYSHHPGVSRRGIAKSVCSTSLRAKRSNPDYRNQRLECFVASLLAMTLRGSLKFKSTQQRASLTTAACAAVRWRERGLRPARRRRFPSSSGFPSPAPDD